MYITHWSILVRGELPKPSPLTWCPPSPPCTLAPQFPLNPGQESHRMLRLELEASRGNWYAAWFFPFSLSLPSPRLVWQGPAELLTGLFGGKNKSSRSLVLRGDLFCPETKGHKSSQKESLLWWPATGLRLTQSPSERSAKQGSRVRPNSLKPGSLTFPRTKAAREQAVISLSPSISLALEQGCGDEWTRVQSQHFLQSADEIMGKLGEKWEF